MEKRASILEDDFVRTIVKGALKSLKYVSIMVMDLKFAAIVMAFESYVEEQERLIEMKNRSQEMPIGYQR